MSGNQPPINLVSDEEIPQHDESDGLSDADFEDVGSSHATEDPYADIYAADTAEKAPHVEQSVASAPSQRIQVTIAAPPPRARAGPTPRDRRNRVLCHKLHVLSILAATRLRNSWCNDVGLRVRCC